MSAWSVLRTVAIGRRLPEEDTVSDRKEQREQEPDELDLDAESVRDLDVDEETARELRGGSLRPTRVTRDQSEDC